MQFGHQKFRGFIVLIVATLLDPRFNADYYDRTQKEATCETPTRVKYLTKKFFEDYANKILSLRAFFPICQDSANFLACDTPNLKKNSRHPKLLQKTLAERRKVAACSFVISCLIGRVKNHQLIGVFKPATF